MTSEWRGQTWLEKQAAAVIATSNPVYALSGEFYFSRRGYGLIRVPSDLGKALFAAMDIPGIEPPPVSPGNLTYQHHITVMSADEVNLLGGPSKINERAKRFRYQLGPICTAVPLGWREMSRVWFVQVQSPDLMQLRRTYGLSSYPMDPESKIQIGFHITIAVRRRNVLYQNDVAKRGV